MSDEDVMRELIESQQREIERLQRTNQGQGVP